MDFYDDGGVGEKLPVRRSKVSILRKRRMPKNNRKKPEDELVSSAVRRALDEMGPLLRSFGPEVKEELAPALATTVRRVVTEVLEERKRRDAHPEVEDLCAQLASLEHMVEEMADAPPEEENWKDRALRRYERYNRPPTTRNLSKMTRPEDDASTKQTQRDKQPRIIKGFTGQSARPTPTPFR